MTTYGSHGDFLCNHCDYPGSPSDCISLTTQVLTGSTHLTIPNLVKSTNFSVCSIYRLVVSQERLKHLNKTNLNSVWPSGTIWWHRFESTWAQVLACCLTTHNYMSQCWLIISEVQWQSLEDSFTWAASAMHQSVKLAWKLLLWDLI